MAEFLTVAATSEILPGVMKVVDLDGEEVAVANLDGTYVAFSNACPHEGGPLAEGELEGETVTCPWHFTTFNVRTGAAIDGVTDAAVPTYEVRIEGDDVRVRRP